MATDTHTTDPQEAAAPQPALARALVRWNSLQRAVRWAIIGGVCIALYFLVVEPVLGAINKMKTSADVAALQLRQYDTQESSRAEAIARIAMGTSAYGQVALPTKDPMMVSRVSDSIARILGDRGVTEWNVQTQRGTSVGKGVLAELYKPDTEDLHRVVFNVTLTDRTATVLGVIADLEQVPEITAIGQAQLRRAEKGKDRISATITPEVWVIVPREATR